MKIISTSDGRISFKKEGYISHHIGGQIRIFSNEITIVHKDFIGFSHSPNANYFWFPTESDAKKASKEITEQLQNN